MVGCKYWFAFLSFLLGIIMACLDDMWAQFSLTEEEKGGAEVPKEEEELIHRLVGWFYTKKGLERGCCGPNVQTSLENCW